MQDKQEPVAVGMFLVQFSFAYLHIYKYVFEFLVCLYYNISFIQ